MDKNSYIQLKKIFNTLQLIHTCGEDTVNMGNCLVALQELLQELQYQIKEEE